MSDSREAARAAATIRRLRRDAMMSGELLGALRSARDYDGHLGREQAALMAEVSVELHERVAALPGQDAAARRHSIRGLGMLTGDLADYSMAGAASLVLAREPLHLRHWLSGFENPSVRVHVAKGVPERVIADAARLSKILSHLINEACEAAPVGSGAVVLEVDSFDSESATPHGSAGHCVVRFVLQTAGADAAGPPRAAKPGRRLRAALAEALCALMHAIPAPLCLSVPFEIAMDQAGIGVSSPAETAATGMRVRDAARPQIDDAIDLLYLDRQLGSLAPLILARTAPAFIDRAPRRMADLYVAHELKDLEWLRSLASAWKGSAMTIGAQCLAAQLHAIEALAAAGRLPGDWQIAQLGLALDALLGALERQPPAAPRVTALQAVPQPSLHRILLVESEQDQAIYWSAVLSSVGFEVCTVASLSEARGMRSDAPRIVACASVVADGRGIDFFATLRERQELALDYLILLASNFGQAEVIESLRCGANDCMDKSASYGEVRARFELAERVISLNEALQQRSSELGAALALIHSELQSAARLQSAILPKTLSHGGMEIRTFYRPSDTLGGDMLGVNAVDADRIAFGLIDIAGHGTASALISCSVIREMMDRMAVLLEAGHGADYESCGRTVIEEMNRRYCRLDIPGFYFTAIAGVLDCRTRSVGFCQAGHPSLYSHAAGCGWSVLEDSGFPVGLLADAEYAHRRIALAPGQILLAVSDGFLRPSAEDPAGSLELLRMLANAPLTSAAILERLAEFAAQAQGRERDDHSAMLIVSS